ncbi:membrane-targeted effector domain-containing toxin [Pantoea sp. A4]|uniref:membrane-targeted effector domain-containing toxin n=1 Tax=Pantoea sp. A4 TaxID=1225184 RepID=UPI000B158D8E|nr:membrane-targeted effector domain-containing toxin [Pantoea sp. A4]
MSTVLPLTHLTPPVIVSPVKPATPETATTPPCATVQAVNPHFDALLLQLKQAQNFRQSLINRLPLPGTAHANLSSSPVPIDFLTLGKRDFISHFAEQTRAFFHPQQAASTALVQSLLDVMAVEMRMLVKLGKLNSSWLARLNHLCTRTSQAFQIFPEHGTARPAQPLPGKIALTQEQGGKLLLWQPGLPLGYYASSTELQQALSEQGEVMWGMTLQPCSSPPAHQLVTDFAEQHIAQLQYTISAAMQPVNANLTLSEHITRLDEAAKPTVARLDLGEIIAHYTQQRDELALYNWFNRAAEAPRRKAWLQSLKQLRGIPARATLASLPARVSATTIEAFASHRLERLAAQQHNVTLSAHNATLSITTVTAGTSVLGSISKAISQTETLTLTEWSLQNIGWLEKGHSRRAWNAGGLSPDQLIDLIRRADVAKYFSQSLFRQWQPETLALIAAGLKTMALTCYINQGLADPPRALQHDALEKVLTVLEHPDPATRPKLQGQPVDVWQFKLGRTPVAEVLLFAQPDLRDPVMFIPNAPDGKMFRGARGGEKTVQTLLQELLAVPGMRQHLAERMPQGNHDRQRMLGHTHDRRGFDPEIIRTDLYQHLWSTRLAIAQAEVAAFARTTALADRLSSAQLGQNIVSSLLSLITPLLPSAAVLSLTISRVAAHSAIAGEAFQHSRTEEGVFALVDALSAVADGVTGGSKNAALRVPRTPLPDPSLTHLAVSQRKPQGLVLARGREPAIWQDSQGQQYLESEGRWFKTATEAGQRIIYSPRNRGDQKSVILQTRRWIVLPQGLPGGAPENDHRLVFIKASFGLDDEEFRVMMQKIRVHHPADADILRFLSSKQGHLADAEIMDFVLRSQQQVTKKRLRQLKNQLSKLPQDFTPIADVPADLQPLYIGGPEAESIMRKHAEGAWTHRLYNLYRDKPAGFIQAMVTQIKDHFGINTPEQTLAINQAMLSQSEKTNEDYRQHSATWKASSQRMGYSTIANTVLTEQQVIRTALQQGRGLIIGEAHHQRAALQFIIDNMALLHESGVRHLFLEDLLPEIHHWDIRQFNQRGEFTSQLQLHVDAATQSTQFNPPMTAEARHYNTENLLRLARQHQITLHGLGSLSASIWRQGAERTESFNYVATRQINNVEGITQRGEKFIALVGYYHVDNYWDNMADGTPFPVTGIAPTTQATSVTLLETTQGSPPRVVVDYQQQTPLAELTGSKLTQSNFVIIKAPATVYAPHHPVASGTNQNS